MWVRIRRIQLLFYCGSGSSFEFSGVEKGKSKEPRSWSKFILNFLIKLQLFPISLDFFSSSIFSFWIRIHSPAGLGFIPYF